PRRRRCATTRDRSAPTKMERPEKLSVRPAPWTGETDRPRKPGHGSTSAIGEADLVVIPSHPVSRSLDAITLPNACERSSPHPIGMYLAGPPLLSRRSRGGFDGVASPDWRPFSKFTAGTARALLQTDSLIPASAEQQEAADACLDIASRKRVSQE